MDDQQDFQAFVREWGGYCRTCIDSRLKGQRIDIHDVDDLMQEVLLKLWDHVEKKKTPIRDMKAFIAHLVSHHVFDVLRRGFRRRSLESLGPEDEPSYTPERPIEQAEEFSDLYDRVEQLYPEVKEHLRRYKAFLMAHENTEQAAKGLGISENSLKVSVHRLKRSMTKVRQQVAYDCYERHLQYWSSVFIRPPKEWGFPPTDRPEVPENIGEIVLKCITVSSLQEVLVSQIGRHIEKAHRFHVLSWLSHALTCTMWALVVLHLKTFPSKRTSDRFASFLCYTTAFLSRADILIAAATLDDDELFAQLNRNEEYVQLAHNVRPLHELVEVLTSHGDREPFPVPSGYKVKNADLFESAAEITAQLLTGRYTPKEAPFRSQKPPA